MTLMKKILVSSAAIGSLLALAAPANAAITQPTATRFVSGASTPAATVAFTLPAFQVDASGTGWSSAFITGNTVTLTLQGGATFAVLPTVVPTNGGTLSFVSGGAGQAFVTYQWGGAVTTTSAINYSNIQVNSVGNVSNAATITAVFTDGAGTLASQIAAVSDRTVNLASFANPYSITFAAGTALVDLGSTSPGSRYTTSTTSSTPGDATLGTITVTPATNALVNWQATPTALTGVVSTGSSLSITVPAGPFVSASAAGTCINPTTGVLQTSITSNVVTFAGTGLTNVLAPGSTSCTLSVTLTNPGTTATALLGAGVTSAALTLGLGGLGSSPTVTGTTRTFNQALTPITYSGGSVVNASYSVGEDVNYNYFINVSNGSTAGPVIVQASVDGSTGTAILSSTIAANTSAIYSIATIRAALVAAGMPGTVFANSGSRGNLQVVVPTGARVTPLLQNKVNGQVVEISRQGAQ